jgi:dihydrofolate reductase
MDKLKIIMVAVISVDGKITKGSNPDVHAWSSPEDSVFFRELIDKQNLIVLGRTTYEAMRGAIKPKPDQLRVVMTHRPELFEKETVKGMLEFSAESPTELTDRLTGQGFQAMLLAGGGTTNGLFLNQGLVDEIFITIEPFIFGSGTNLITEEELDINLELLDQRQLNNKGTILAHYRVIHRP